MRQEEQEDFQKWHRKHAMPYYRKMIFRKHLRIVPLSFLAGYGAVWSYTRLAGLPFGDTAFTWHGPSRC